MLDLILGKRKKKKMQHGKRKHLPLGDVTISKPSPLSSFPELSPAVIDIGWQVINAETSWDSGHFKEAEILGHRGGECWLRHCWGSQVAEMGTRQTHLAEPTLIASSV